ncbi:bacteriohemerythrin [Magnetospirillum sp. SS-4]|uniref:bacteriohemerythrin n=1 Tax=Magnetospirillum sp. SS-4 TaxID=2681465 RepID=UPI001571FC6C|nr:hemerythrin family protein [Magnetospirillum sp. SS-4]
MLCLTDDMQIGNAVIDEDHRRLVGIINQFLDASAVHTEFDGSTAIEYATVMHKTLKSLISYSKEHFEREERIQRECMYEYHDMHVHEHRAIVAQLEEIARTYFVNKSKPLNKGALNELNGFMKHWLINHVKKFDTNMRKWVCSEE